MGASLMNDRRIEEAAKESYSLRVVLADQGSVTVAALNGVVSLSGVVRDEEGRIWAEATVDNIPGVARVDNQLTLAPGEPGQEDESIGRAIRRRLLTRVQVDVDGLRIVVREGIATLSGSVASEYQKDFLGSQVGLVARVRGVQNDLIITPRAGLSQAVVPSIDDPSINAQVKEALSARACASDSRTRIRTRDGMVMVSGFVESEGEKESITRLAREVRGVQGVVNSMRVRR